MFGDEVIITSYYYLVLKVNVWHDQALKHVFQPYAFGNETYIIGPKDM